MEKKRKRQRKGGREVGKEREEKVCLPLTLTHIEAGFPIDL